MSRFQKCTQRFLFWDLGFGSSAWQPCILHELAVSFLYPNMGLSAFLQWKLILQERKKQIKWGKCVLFDNGSLEPAFCRARLLELKKREQPTSEIRAKYSSNLKAVTVWEKSDVKQSQFYSSHQDSLCTCSHYCLYCIKWKWISHCIENPYGIQLLNRNCPKSISCNSLVILWD